MQLIDVAVFAIEADFSALERPIGGRECAGATFGRLEFAPVVFVLPEQIGADGEFVLEEGFAEIVFDAVVVPTADAGAELRGVATEEGALAGGVDDAAGRADAEQHGVGAAGEIDALDVEHIGRQPPREVIAADGRLDEAADLDVHVVRDEEIAGEVAGVLGGVERKIERRLDVENPEVGQEFGGENRNRRGRVPDF